MMLVLLLQLLLLLLLAATIPVSADLHGQKRLLLLL